MRRAGRRSVPVLLSGLAVGAAVSAGLALANGASRAQVVVPLAVALAAALALLALCRFESLVIALLALRASLDAIKIGAPAGRVVDPATIVAVMFGGAAALWLIARRGSRGPERSSAAAHALLAFAAAGALSLVSAKEVGGGATDLARIGAAAVMLLVLERLLVDRRVLPRVLVAVYASAVVPLAAGALQVVTGSGVVERGDFARITGTFVHPNPFGIYLALLFVMGVALLPHTTDRTRALLRVQLAACGAALLLTYTRAAWIAAAVGVAVVLWIQARHLLPVLALGAALLVLTVPGVGDRFADLDDGRQASGAPSNSLAWRIDFWSESADLARGAQFTGVGLRGTTALTAQGKEPHNDLVRAYVETGLLGLVAYLAFLAALVRTAARGIRARGGGLERGAAVGFAGCVAVFLVVSAVSNVLSQVVLLWYFLAFAAAASVRASREVGGLDRGGSAIRGGVLSRARAEGVRDVEREGERWRRGAT